MRLSAEVVRFRRERWLTPAGETVLAPLPAGIVGGFGPGLRRFLLVAHAQGRVTAERLAALLNGIGAEISKRQVVRLLTSRLDGLLAEDRNALRAGLATRACKTVGGLVPTQGRARAYGARRSVPKLVWRVKLVAELQPSMPAEASPHGFACSRPKAGWPGSK